MDMKKVQTNTGGFLVIVNALYGCYVNKDFEFIRSVDGIDHEIEWAKKEWKQYEEVPVTESERESLLCEIKYIQEYQNSL
ncbi:MAG: hypothetical protein ACP5N7_00650 [Candidatus Pacearchaeota archaeon]